VELGKVIMVVKVNKVVVIDAKKDIKTVIIKNDETQFKQQPCLWKRRFKKNYRCVDTPLNYISFTEYCVMQV